MLDVDHFTGSGKVVGWGCGVLQVPISWAKLTVFQTGRYFGISGLCFGRSDGIPAQ